MIFFLPTSTDAPIYHWPFATVGLIIANVMIFLGLAAGSIQNPNDWLLVYGDSLTPVQWLTSTFNHQDVGHLLGNMLFLWIFGLVVEGKLGWWKFLLCYLAIGILQSAMEQSIQLALGGTGASLGASSAIYGLIAIAAIWAPKNEVSIWYFYFFMFIASAGTFEVPVMAFAGFYIGLDVVLSFFTGLNSSSWLHVGGVLIGLPLGIALLKFGIVDCEGWDIFHVMRDETGNKVDEKQIEHLEAAAAERRQKSESQIVDNAREQIAQLVDQGNTETALGLYKKLNDQAEGLQLPREVLLKMIATMHRKKQWRASCPLMHEVLERFPDKPNEAVRIKLAQICVVELARPGKAIDLLHELDLNSLPPELLKLTHKIAQKAKQMQREGLVELDDGGW